MPAPNQADEEASSLSGLVAALCAFLLWGFLPLYWKAVASVDSFEIVCHRIFWSFFMLLPCMFFHGRLGQVRLFLKSGRNALVLLCSSCVLAGNWLLYIWAINSGLVLEASLGYFINPLVNILFGILIFREKTSPLVRLAILLAAAGVGYQIVALGSFPIVPLALALSFGLYALLRKLMLLPSLPGLFAETLLLMPLAGAVIFWRIHQGLSPAFSGDFRLDLLLIGAGLATSLPLICFAFGTRRIKMTTLGLLQYVNPTIVFLLGIFVYREDFSTDSLVTFSCIWTALALYSWDTIRRRRW